MERIEEKSDPDLSPEREIFTLSGRDYITHYQVRKGSFLLAIVLLAIFIGAVLLRLPARAAFVSAGVLVFSSLLAIYPYLGLFAQIYLYFRPFPVWGGPEFLRPIFLVTIITMVFFVLNFIVIKKKRIRFSIECKWAFAFLLCMVLSSFFAAHSTSISFSQNIIFLKIILFYFLVVNLVTTERELDGIIWVIIACCALAALEAVRLYRYYGFLRVDTVGGTHREANYLAVTLVLALPLVFQKLSSRSLIEKVISIGLVPVFLVGLILTGSRSGTLGLVAVLILLVWRFRRNRGILSLLVILVLAAVILAPGHFWTRTRTIVDYEQDRSAQSRLELWEAGLQMYADHPLTGVGQGNFIWISPQYTHSYSEVWTGQGFVAHNIYIQLLSEGGLQTLLAFLFFVGLTLRGIHRARKKLGLYRGGENLQGISYAVEIGLIGFLISGFFLSSAHLDILYWFLAIGPVISFLTDRKLRLSEEMMGPAEETRQAASFSAAAP